MNERAPYDPKFLHLIYSVLLIMQLMLISVVMFIAGDKVQLDCSIEKHTQITVPIIALSLIALGKAIWKNGMEQISSEEEISDKLQILTKIHVYQWAIVQFGTILLLTYTLIEANFYYFIFSLVNIIYFFTLRPKIFSLTGGV